MKVYAKHMKTVKEMTNMKVIDSPEFNQQFPETYNWNLIESYKLGDLASALSRAIKQDLQTEDRNETAGLRRALNILASHANI